MPKIRNLTCLFLMLAVNMTWGQLSNGDDYDGDGIINSIDLDDDNDGITDQLEGYKPLTDLCGPTTISVKNGSMNGTPGNMANGIVPLGWTPDGSTDLGDASSAIDGVAGILTASPDGGSFIRMVASNNYSEKISQTLSGFNIGKQYYVSFYQALVRNWAQEAGEVEVELFNTKLKSPKIPLPVTNPASTDWELVFIGPFTATSNSSLLSFSPFSVGGNNEFTDILIDGVKVCEANSIAITGLDTDGDGFPDHLDRDADNDGCADAIEAGHSVSMLEDSIVAGPYGNNGLANQLEINDSDETALNYQIAGDGSSFNFQNSNVSDCNECPEMNTSISGNTTYCSGDTLELTASGGYTFAWSGPNNLSQSGATLVLQNLDNTQQGVYQVITEYDQDCFDTTSVNIEILEIALPLISGSDNVCQGQPIIFHSEDKDSISMEWFFNNKLISDSDTAIVNTNILSPGIHQVQLELTSFDGCHQSAIKTFEVSAPSFSTTLVFQLDNCTSYSARVEHDVTGTFNYSLNGVSQSSNQLFSLIPGETYTVEITSDQHCGYDTTFTVPDLLVPLQHAFMDSICAGDSLQFAGQWLSQPGTYRDTMSATNGCDSIIKLTLTERTIDFTVGFEFQKESCQTQQLTINTYPAGNYQYWLEGNAVTEVVPNLTAGSYDLTIQPQAGCPFDTVVVVPSGSETPITERVDSFCSGETYIFNGDTIFTAGVYYDTLQSNGCDSIIELTLTERTIDFTVDFEFQKESCQTQQLIINTYPAGNYQYWLEGNAATEVVPNLTAGSYALTIQPQASCPFDTVVMVPSGSETPIMERVDSFCSGEAYLFNDDTLWTAGVYYDTLQSNGCDSIIELTLTERTIDFTVGFEFQKESCQTQQLTINTYPAGNYQYWLESNAVTEVVSNLTAGSYDLTIQPQAVCPFDTVVMVPSGSETPITERVDSFCSGETYIFNGDTIFTAGVYYDTLQSNGCDSIIELTLTERTIDFTVGFEFQKESCQTQQLIINTYPAGNYQYWLEDNAVSEVVPNLAAGSYDLTIQPQAGCPFDTVVVVPSGSEIPITERVDSFCSGEAYLFNGDTLWTAGVYYDTLQSNGCDSIIELTLTENSVDFEYEITQTGCDNAILNYSIIEGLPGFSARLNGQTINQQHIISEGQYQLQITDALGCQSNKIVSFTSKNPVVELGQDTIITLGESIVLSPKISGDIKSKRLIPAVDSMDYTIRPTGNTRYILEVESVQGCIQSDTMNIEVLFYREDVYIPNIFTPNGDGQNDFFTVYAAGNSIKTITNLMIFDRWGEMVYYKPIFTAGNEQEGWSGFYQNELLPNGIYIYSFVVEYTDGVKKTYSGDISLFR